VYVYTSISLYTGIAEYCIEVNCGHLVTGSCGHGVNWSSATKRTTDQLVSIKYNYFHVVEHACMLLPFLKSAVSFLLKKIKNEINT